MKDRKIGTGAEEKMEEETRNERNEKKAEEGEAEEE